LGQQEFFLAPQGNANDQEVNSFFDLLLLVFELNDLGIDVEEELGLLR